MIKGAGILKLVFSLEEGGVFPESSVALCYSLFTFRTESIAEPFSYLNLSGIKQNKSSRIQEEQYFIDLTLSEFDFMTLQLSMGEIAAQVDDVNFYEEVNICPLNNTVYSDLRINATNYTQITAFNLTENNIMVRVTNVEDVGSNFFFVDEVAQTITFSENQLGEALKVVIPVANNDVGCIGGPNARGEMYKYAFEGKFFTTEGDGPYTLQAPCVRRVSAPSLSFDGGAAATYVLSFECVANEESDRKPFKIFSPRVNAPTAENLRLLENGLDFRLLENDTDLRQLENSV